ncbi:unnamed protein product [Linum trigynum]|uniref:RNase H type-1 domain-containing protein n=1 Tax=Linum trigynum TaxID=586398 RepID=A0AAV2FQ62_9ROSI
MVQSVTCMWDDATKPGSHAAGGIVLKDLAGNIMLARGVQFPGLDSPLVAEALTLREAVTWCLELGFHVVCFQGDAQSIIDKVTKRDVHDVQIGAILEEIVGVFANHSALQVRFAGRSNNRVTHSVARNALVLFPATSCCYDFQTWLTSKM